MIVLSHYENSCIIIVCGKAISKFPSKFKYKLIHDWMYEMQ